MVDHYTEVLPKPLTGAEKVAALLLVMGPPGASRLLKHFDPSELRLITRAAADLGSVPSAAIEHLIDEFYDSFSAGLDLMGNAGQAQQLMAGVLPPDQIADIMTAMMAFFLVLWLVNSTTQEGKNSIAHYFNPIKLVDSSASKKGLDPNKDAEPKGASKSESKDGAEGKEGKEGSGSGQGAASVQKVEVKPVAQKDKTPAIGDPLGEQGLFANPESILAALATKPDPQSDKGGERERIGQGTAAGGTAYRDPFKPLTRRGDEPLLDIDDSLRVPGGLAGELGKPGKGVLERLLEPAPAPAPASPADAKTANDGKDGSRKIADVKLPESKNTEGKTRESKQADAIGTEAKATEAKAGEARQAEAAKLREDLAQKMRDETAGGLAPAFDVRATPEGILVSLTDNALYSMFEVGSAQPSPKVVRMMQEMGEVLRARPGSIVVRGHTDARPFRGNGYDNWRLSADRAQIARYMLLRGGIPEARIEHVEGWADRRLKVADRPEAAENRRLEILIRMPPS